jgi:hypothetical protein
LLPKLRFGNETIGKSWGRRTPVTTFISWFPPALVGVFFTVFGSLKLYGVVRGIEGGRDKPTFQYVCGT